MTYEEAVDYMNGVFYAAWGTINPVEWDGFPATPPSTETPWAVVRICHTGGGQKTLAGDTGTRRFGRHGIIAISIFVPAGNGKTAAYQLAQQVANAYEDAKLDVWFRNTRIVEKGASGAFEQIDVLTDFQYDEVR